MEPNTPRAEAERWLGIAAKMLASRDLVGSRSFAIRGREADPTNPISEQIIAIVDTLIAAEKRVTNSGHHDWYSILQVSHLARDLDLIASQYRRLFLLLNPDHNHFPFADYALRAVADAWSVLSDPSKKWMYDSELSNFLQRSSVQSPDPEPPVVRVDSSSAAATYQFFHQPTQQQQWIHHIHPSEQPPVQLQERQLFQQQQQHQHQWLPQTQLQQLLPEHQRPSQPQWLPQQPNPHQPQPPQQQPWMPEQQRPPPAPKEPPIQPQLHRPAPQPKEPPAPQLQRPKEPQIPSQPHRQKQQQNNSLPSPPSQPQPPSSQPQPPPIQTPPFQQQPQRPPQQPPQQPPPQPPPQEPPQEPVREKEVNEEEVENGNTENDCNQSASKYNNDVNHDDVEEIESFWTACPYCYYLYEYPTTFQDCTLRCQNCRRAFQAIPVPGPPGNGGESSFCSWGFFPIGFSMSNWKKKNTNRFGSNWMPFSPMFACPVQKPKKKVWEIVDEDEDELDNISDSSDDPDSSEDWGSTRKKGKRRKSNRGRPRKKRSYIEKEKMVNNDVVNGDNPQREKNDAVNNNNNKAVASGTLRKQRGRKKLDLNVEFSNEVEDHAPVRREGNNGEEVVEFFEGLDEFLSTLPILHVVGDEKGKAS